MPRTEHEETQRIAAAAASAERALAALRRPPRAIPLVQRWLATFDTLRERYDMCAEGRVH